VYTNTDVIFTQNSKGYRHYIIARSGAPTANFEMQYTGQTSLTVDALGNLKIATTLGTLKQPKAKAYTMNNTTGVLTLLGWQPTYVVTGGNKVSFTYGSWPAGSTLVIELEAGSEAMDEFSPIYNLGWSTFAGGVADDSYNSVYTDTEGAQYAAGRSWSPMFPVANALQAFNLGTSAAVWNKFSVIHEMEYGTFYGGSNSNDLGTFATDIDVIGQYGMPNHAVYLVGVTSDPNLNIITIPGASNDNTTNGAGDGFIARFNGDGYLYWSRFFGGDVTDYMGDITHDNFSNVYFTGYTLSSATTFPLVNPGGSTYYQGTSNGAFDGFIGKLNGNLQLTWSTYYGGSSIDISEEVEFDTELNCLYISGYSESTNLPVGANYFDNTLNGSSDAFITKFSDAGVRLWATYLGGNNVEGAVATGATNISIGNNKIFLSTPTTSTNLSSAYSGITWGDNSLAGTQDVFVMAINSVNLQPLWATYFGGLDIEICSDIVEDHTGGFFLTGMSESSEFALVDNLGASYQQIYHEDNCVGDYDESFLVHYNPYYTKDWFTYFGGYNSCYDVVSYSDFPQGMAYYDDGNTGYLYLAGYCGDYTVSEEVENFPRVDFDGSGVISYFDPIYKGSSQDAFVSMFKIDVNATTDLESNPSNFQSLIIYPVPSTNQINLYLPNSNFKNIDIAVYDILGQQVIEIDQVFVSEDKSINIDVQQLAKGQYTLLLKENNSILSKGRFIKE
jgi:hypothetical protein